MKKYQVEFGPLVGSRRALWLTGEVDTLKIGDILTAENGDRITIDAIGMSNRRTKDSLSVLAKGNVNTNIRTVFVNQ